MMPHFPFVVIPVAASVQSLLASRPLQLLAIVAAASYDDLKLQRRLGDAFKRLITHRIFYVEAMSLETLQALLVHLAWCVAYRLVLSIRCLSPMVAFANVICRTQYHDRPRRYSQYLELAISIVIDLRLDRKPEMRPWKRRLDMQVNASDPKDALSIDEQRAVAGCYYLSCSIAKLLQKHCTFPWSAHVEQCCATIDQRQQSPTVGVHSTAR